MHHWTLNQFGYRAVVATETMLGRMCLGQRGVDQDESSLPLGEKKMDLMVLLIRSRASVGFFFVSLYYVRQAGTI